MNRREFIKKAGLSVASIAVGGCAASQKMRVSGHARPNFVFILIDDLGWMDVGCYGSRFYETPHIDKLAREGMRFTNAYAACPVCSPTRVSIMTGKYPARVNLTNYIAGDRSGKLIGADYLHYMPLEEVTIAEALKAAGYTSACIGKWHLTDGRTPTGPRNQGFDLEIQRNKSGHWTENNEYLTDTLTDNAIRFIEKNRDVPFLLYLSHYAVHIPLQAKKELVEKYRARADGLPRIDCKFKVAENQAYSAFDKTIGMRLVQDHRIYAAMIESVDESVGRIMDKLKKLGLEQNTVGIFMSDNGGLCSTNEGAPTSNLPLRAGKGWLYEGGIREPMIIKWPGVTRAGSVCDVAVTSTDFYPTMLEIANLPLRPEQHADGVSLVPLLKGGGALDERPLFWHYPHYGNQGGRPGGAVRMGDYKLIEWYDDFSVELYNLRDDIGEENNLAEKMPEKAGELREMLHSWRELVDAKMPKPNPDYQPKEQEEQ